jgi:hypothetical protein
MAKTKRQLADEAYRRVYEGQIDLEDQARELAAQEARGDTIVPEGPPDTGEPLSEPPASCPACGAARSPVLLWAYMRQGDERRTWRIQCVLCGHIVRVTAAAWEKLRTDTRKRFPGLTRPAREKKPKQDRGAR